MSRIDFKNTTELSDARLFPLCRQALEAWAVGTVTLRIRYSRGADFSGTCFYTSRRIYVNLGRHLAYPYLMNTHLARARTVGSGWYKPVCRIEMRNGYDVVLFVFMHELYHLLVKKARRNTRQKESMCDRFAARFLVDRFGRRVLDGRGKPLPRSQWDFQDLDRFVAPARNRRGHTRAKSPEPVFSSTPTTQQLLLFPT